MPNSIIKSFVNHVPAALSAARMSTTAKAVAPSLLSAMQQIEATFDPSRSRSFEMNWNRLHESVAKDLKDLYNDKSDKTSPRDKYEAGELLRFIGALHDFGEKYDIGRGVAGGVKRLDELAIPAHRDFLMQELDSRINDSALDQDGKQLFAQMAGRDALKQFGIDQSMRSAGSHRAPPGVHRAVLNMDQLLAITDYTHPDTGTFNVIIPAGRMAQHGQAKFKQAIAPLYEPLTSGLERLAHDPQFGVSGQTFYKALNLNLNKWAEGALWNSMWKDRFSSGEDNYSFGHPISVTDGVEKTYADRDGYDHIAQFSGFRAADVSLFNPGELIIPEGQTANATITGFSTTEVVQRERGTKDAGTIEFKCGTGSERQG